MSRNDDHLWFKLDNAAKIYPVLTTERYTHVFRVSATLHETIQPELLKQAIFRTRRRFPSFFIKMKHGLFWYYFEPNKLEPRVLPEPPQVCQKIHFHNNNGYFFTFFYYQNRISLEVFHALTDGYGAIMFLETVLYEYLTLLKLPVTPEGLHHQIQQHPSYDELLDAYEENFTNQFLPKKKVKSAYQYVNKHFAYPGSGIINAKMDTQALLKISKANQVSLTQYITALLIYSVIQVGNQKELYKRPVKITLPINLRSFYHSNTLRNFSLYFHSSYQVTDKPVTLSDILEKVKQDFVEGLNPTEIQDKLNRNVRLVKNFFIRTIPLPLKKGLFRLGYQFYGRKPTTLAFSNFGQVSLPPTMVPYIKAFSFHLGSGDKPVVAMNSYEGITSIIFSRAVISTELERTFFTLLTEQGLKITIESNYWEENKK